MPEPPRTLESVTNRDSARVFVLENAGPAFASAKFDPAVKTFSRIDTTTGTFLVSVQNAVPYIDGFKVTCNFGNPSSTTYNGFKVNVKWGAHFDPVKRAEWLKTLQEKEITLSETLRAGSWNPISFVVSPAKADQFGYLELSMATDNVSLFK